MVREVIAMSAPLEESAPMRTLFMGSCAECGWMSELQRQLVSLYKHDKQGAAKGIEMHRIAGCQGGEGEEAAHIRFDRRSGSRHPTDR